MNVLFTRISTISVVLFVCLCSALEARADKSDDYFLLEARLSKKTMRSSAPQQQLPPVQLSPVRVDLMGSEISLMFYQQLGEVSIKVYDHLMRPVYYGYATNPQFEYVSTDGFRTGTYVVQVTAGTKTYIEYVFVD